MLLFLLLPACIDMSDYAHQCIRHDYYNCPILENSFYSRVTVDICDHNRILAVRGCAAIYKCESYGATVIMDPCIDKLGRKGFRQIMCKDFNFYYGKCVSHNSWL